jgi:hypothetical protein
VGKAGSGESKEWEPDPEDHEFVDGKQKYPRDDKKYFYDCYCIRKTG